MMRHLSSKPGDEQIRFKEYVDRTMEGQYDFYYITGESIAAASSSPFVETLRKEGRGGLVPGGPDRRLRRASVE